MKMNKTSVFPKFNPPIATLLFDLDGTLVDSEHAGLEMLHQLACKQGLTWSHAQSLSCFRGVPMARCVSVIAQHLPPGQQALDEVAFLRELRTAMAARFRQDLQEIPGASSLLAGLQIPFAVATNGPREKAELTLSLTGLDRWLHNRVFCAPEVGSYKPDPGLFLHAAHALGSDPRQCAVVEDSLPGMRAGLATGMRVFSLHPAQGLPADVRRQVIFIDGLPDLQRWL